MGLNNSSMANSMTGLVLQQLKKDGEIEQSISPNFLLRNWPPVFTEWSTKSIRDAFFASPIVPVFRKISSFRGEATPYDQLSRYAAAKGLRISLDVEVSPDGGLSKHQMDEIRTALRELGLPDDVEVSE